MFFIKVNREGRITAMADPGFHCGEGEIALDALPDGFDPAHAADWVLEKGVLIFDPRPAAPDSVSETSLRLDTLEAAIIELAALIGGDEA